MATPAFQKSGWRITAAAERKPPNDHPMMPTRGIACAVSLWLAACAQPQTLTIAPEVRVAGGEPGAGRPVQLSVADKRASQALGDNPTYEAGDYTVRGDLAAIVREALSTGLTRLGFDPSAPAARELRVEILALDYGIVERSGVSRHVEAGSRLRAQCVRDAKPALERTHRGELRKPVFLTALEERANSAHASAVVSDAINALLADRQLIACLAQ